MPSNHLILCRPFLFCLQSFPASGFFSNESVLRIRWPEFWSFSFSINEHPGLISFIMDWLDLLAVQGTLKSLLQYHSSRASVLWCSAFFIVQLSHPYMTPGKTVALTRCIFAGKVPIGWLPIFKYSSFTGKQKSAIYPNSTYHFCIFSSKEWGLLLLHILISIWCFQCCNGHFNRCVVIGHCCFNLHFLSNI